MALIFSIKDKSGRLIYLTKNGWKHIVSRHPVLSNKIEDITETLKNPSVRKQSGHSEKVWYCYRYYKNLKEYLMVIVRYLNGVGYIMTSYYVKRLK